MEKLPLKKASFLLAIALFLFIFSFNFSSAVNITSVQTGSLSSTRGTAGLIWDNTGHNLYAVDSCSNGFVNGAHPNFITQYTTSSPYDISNLNAINNTNLTLYFPSNQLAIKGGVNMTLTNTTQGWNIDSFYITRDGNNLYLVVDDSNCNKFDTLGTHAQSYVILHYTMTNFDLTTLTYSEQLFFYGGEKDSSYSQFWGTFGSAYTFPQIRGIYVSDLGNYLVLSGSSFNSIDSINIPSYYYFNMSTPYSIINLVNGSEISPQTVTNKSYPFAFNRSTTSQYAFYSNLQVASDGSFFSLSQRNPHSSSFNIMMGVSAVQGGMIQPVTSTDSEGLTFASYNGNLYVFSQTGGTITKSQVFDLGAPISGQPQQTEGQQITTSFVSGIVNLFPDPVTLTFAQKMGYVFVFMLFSAIIILLAGVFSGVGVGVVLGIIILLIEFVEFIFFVSIGYIPVSFVVLLVLIGLGIGFLAIRRK